MSRQVEELSASGIKRFRDCPRQYQLHYLSDVPEPDEGEVEHFQIGNTVHDSVENVLKEQPEIVNENEEVIHDALVSEEDTLDYNYQDNQSKVTTSIETASRWISSFVTEVKHVEEEWTMDRGSIKFKGLADLVADVEQGDEVYEDVIIDWKTGQENDEWKEKVQSGMYIEMFYDKFGHYPDAAVFVYLNEETQSFHSRIRNGEVYWNENENKYWEQIEKYKNKILQREIEGVWPTKPEQSRCFFCSFKHYCQDSGVGAENVEPRHIQFGKL